MNPRTTIIIGAIFLLLAGYVFLFEWNKTPEQLSRQLGTPTATPPRYVLQFDATQVASFQIADLRAPRQVEVKRDRANWQVTVPASKPADNFTIDSTLNTLANLRVSRVFTNVTNLGQYGFITPTLEVRVVMNDARQYAITIGDHSSSGSTYYATYTGDKTQVFMIDSSIIDALKDWLETPSYEPTPVPTFTPTSTPAATSTPEATPTLAAPTK